MYLDEASVRGTPTQNRPLSLSLGGQEKADFAHTFGGERARSEIGSEYGLPVSSGAETGAFWTNDALGPGVSGAGGAGILETDPMDGVNSESTWGID